MKSFTTVLALHALIAFAASMPQDAVMPEQEFGLVMSTDDIITFLQENAEQSKTDPDGALESLTGMLQADPTHLSALANAINALIDQIKGEHAEDKKKSQAAVTASGKSLQACAEKSEVDQDKTAAKNTAQTNQDDAEGKVTAASTGKVNYNLGDSTGSSATAVTSVNDEMTRLKSDFDKLIGVRTAARAALKLATSELIAANKALYDSKHQCFCLKKNAFDTLFATANDATEINHELAHFNTVKCVVNGYKTGNLHKNALNNCKDEYDNLAKTKGLDKDSGTVNDARFTNCEQFKAPVFKVWESPEGRTTWPQAKDLCAKEGMKLCSLKAICPNGPGEAPIGGYDTKKDQWIPVADSENDWVNGFEGRNDAERKNLPLCTLHQDCPVYKGDPKPDWGMGDPCPARVIKHYGSCGWKNAKVPCCQ